MISFRRVDNNIIFTYSSDFTYSDWVRKDLTEKGHAIIKSIFYFENKDVFIDLEEEEIDDDIYEDEPYPISFLFANKEDSYFKIVKNVLVENVDIYFHEDIDFELKFFLADVKYSVFKQIEGLVNQDLFIGGNNPNAIPFDAFKQIIKSFPNSYEKRLYTESRVSTILRNYFEDVPDVEKKFNRYLNKKISKKGKGLSKIFKAYELEKYTTILEKLEDMLSHINSYNEDQWQDEILEIILLLYPKYIRAFKSTHIKADFKNKFLDFLLVDGNGHIDIIEVKKPSNDSIMSHSLYRKNHIPKRELSGTIMQLEKYIYYLNRWGGRGEKKLLEKLKDNLPKDFEIKIINPQGFIIMGRENDLTRSQKKDFEVIKRKYKNVIDIITYDDLIERLKMTIEQIKKR
ncbi:Shedu immune nuclease family protein [Winogradskyella forsetii]|uniref:Shedu immune nuclease family protein n=1 Tax=Winogradskyella forsetii TaxID=2686077 RepID=UPI0015BDB187|nr:Shedu immune nuclease family protein [Winogradskyella forsetii]